MSHIVRNFKNKSFIFVGGKVWSVKFYFFQLFSRKLVRRGVGPLFTNWRVGEKKLTYSDSFGRLQKI